MHILFCQEPVPLMGRSAILGEQRNNYFCDVACGRGEMVSFFLFPIQCRSRISPGFDPSILRHSRIRVERKKSKKSPCFKFFPLVVCGSGFDTFKIISNPDANINRVYDLHRAALHTDFSEAVRMESMSTFNVFG